MSGRGYRATKRRGLAPGRAVAMTLAPGGGGGYSRARRAALPRTFGVPRGVPAVQVAQAVRAYQAQKRDAGYVDLAVANYALDTTGSITLLTTIAQGASVNQRIGKKAVYKSLQIRGAVTSNGTAIANDAALILVLDRKPTNALPAITDVLVSANARAFNNDVNSDRFKILRRWDFQLLGNTTAPATGLEGFSADAFVPMKGIPIEFNAAGTGAIGDISKNALYLITVGVNAAGGTAANATLAFRTRFTEV